jgi:hypothetical protein
VRNGLHSLDKNGRVPTKVKGGTYIRKQCRKIRREMALEFTALHGRDPSIHEHIALKVAARAEARAMLHERLLADEWDKLTHEQKTTSLTAIGAAGDQLVRMSKEAGLNRQADGGDHQQRLKRIRARASIQTQTATPAQPTGDGSPDSRPATSDAPQSLVGDLNHGLDKRQSPDNSVTVLEDKPAGTETVEIKVPHGDPAPDIACPADSQTPDFESK